MATDDNKLKQIKKECWQERREHYGFISNVSLDTWSNLISE